MSEPNIAQRNPAVLDLEPGTYAWCQCGESSNQPFCDGTHKVKGIFTPIVFKVEEKKKAALCQCKNSGNKPYCDGTHKTLG